MTKEGESHLRFCAIESSDIPPDVDMAMHGPDLLESELQAPPAFT